MKLSQVILLFAVAILGVSGRGSYSGWSQYADVSSNSFGGGRGASGHSGRLLRPPDAAPGAKSAIVTDAAVAEDQFSGAAVLPSGAVMAQRHLQAPPSERQLRLVREPSSLLEQSLVAHQAVAEECPWMENNWFTACTNDLNTDQDVLFTAAQAYCDSQNTCAGFLWLTAAKNQAAGGANVTEATYCRTTPDESPEFVMGTRSATSKVAWMRHCESAPTPSPASGGWIVSNAAVVFNGLDPARFNAENGEMVFKKEMRHPKAFGTRTEFMNIQCMAVAGSMIEEPKTKTMGKAKVSFKMTGTFAMLDVDKVNTSEEAKALIVARLSDDTADTGFQAMLQKHLQLDGDPFSEATVDSAATKALASAITMASMPPTPPPTEDVHDMPDLHNGAEDDHETSPEDLPEYYSDRFEMHHYGGCDDEDDFLLHGMHPTNRTGKHEIDVNGSVTSCLDVCMEDAACGFVTEVTFTDDDGKQNKKVCYTYDFTEIKCENVANSCMFNISGNGFDMTKQYDCKVWGRKGTTTSTSTITSSTMTSWTTTGAPTPMPVTTLTSVTQTTTLMFQAMPAAPVIKPPTHPAAGAKYNGTEGLSNSQLKEWLEYFLTKQNEANQAAAAAKSGKTDEEMEEWKKQREEHEKAKAEWETNIMQLEAEIERIRQMQTQGAASNPPTAFPTPPPTNAPPGSSDEGVWNDSDEVAQAEEERATDGNMLKGGQDLPVMTTSTETSATVTTTTHTGSTTTKTTSSTETATITTTTHTGSTTTKSTVTTTTHTGSTTTWSSSTISTTATQTATKSTTTHTGSTTTKTITTTTHTGSTTTGSSTTGTMTTDTVTTTRAAECMGFCSGVPDLGVKCDPGSFLKGACKGCPECKGFLGGGGKFNMEGVCEGDFVANVCKTEAADMAWSQKCAWHICKPCKECVGLKAGSKTTTTHTGSTTTKSTTTHTGSTTTGTATITGTKTDTDTTTTTTHTGSSTTKSTITTTTHTGSTTTKTKTFTTSKTTTTTTHTGSTTTRTTTRTSTITGTQTSTFSITTTTHTGSTTTKTITTVTKTTTTHTGSTTTGTSTEENDGSGEVCRLFPGKNLPRNPKLPGAKGQRSTAFSSQDCCRICDNVAGCTSFVYDKETYACNLHGGTPDFYATNRDLVAGFPISANTEPTTSSTKTTTTHTGSTTTKTTSTTTHTGSTTTKTSTITMTETTSTTTHTGSTTTRTTTVTETITSTTHTGSTTTKTDTTATATSVTSVTSTTFSTTTHTGSTTTATTTTTTHTGSTTTKTTTRTTTTNTNTGTATSISTTTHTGSTTTGTTKTGTTITTTTHTGSTTTATSSTLTTSTTTHTGSTTTRTTTLTATVTNTNTNTTTITSTTHTGSTTTKTATATPTTNTKTITTTTHTGSTTTKTTTVTTYTSITTTTHTGSTTTGSSTTFSTVTKTTTTHTGSTTTKTTTIYTTKTKTTSTHTGSTTTKTTTIITTSTKTSSTHTGSTTTNTLSSTPTSSSMTATDTSTTKTASTHTVSTTISSTTGTDTKSTTTHTGSTTTKSTVTTTTHTGSSTTWSSTTWTSTTHTGSTTTKSTTSLTTVTSTTHTGSSTTLTESVSLTTSTGETTTPEIIAWETSQTQGQTEFPNPNVLPAVNLSTPAPPPPRDVVCSFTLENVAFNLLSNTDKGNIITAVAKNLAATAEVPLQDVEVVLGEGSTKVTATIIVPDDASSANVQTNVGGPLGDQMLGQVVEQVQSSLETDNSTALTGSVSTPGLMVTTAIRPGYAPTNAEPVRALSTASSSDSQAKTQVDDKELETKVKDIMKELKNSGLVYEPHRGLLLMLLFLTLGFQLNAGAVQTRDQTRG